MADAAAGRTFKLNLLLQAQTGNVDTESNAKQTTTETRVRIPPGSPGSAAPFDPVAQRKGAVAQILSLRLNAVGGVCVPAQESPLKGEYLRTRPGERIPPSATFLA